MTRLLLLLIILASPAFAQDVRDEVEADLDRNGEVEIYALLYDGPDSAEPSYSADLSVETDEGIRRVEKIAWSGGLNGSLPELDAGPAGTLLLTSSHGAYGRHRWGETITIAHREGDWYVTEVRYGWYDPLDLDAGGSCEVDLLSGQGVATAADGSREVEAPFPARRLWEWEAGMFNPLEVCGFQ